MRSAGFDGLVFFLFTLVGSPPAARAQNVEPGSARVVAGLHFHWPFLSLTAAGGYGTWFLPWIYLPVGESTASGELDVYFRF